MPLEKNESAGFTLIEMAIVVIIIGVLMLPLIKIYDNYLLGHREEVTRERIENGLLQLVNFLSPNVRLPCPADRTLAPEDANAGVEVCGAALPAVGSCSAGGGICVVAGQRDADGTPGNDPVVIGALPYKTISEFNNVFFGKDDALDGWGNKLLYAAPLSLITGYSDNLGVIKVIDEFGLDTAGIEDDGLYVVVSHGRNGNGAFDSGGRRNVACGPLAASRDNENCNEDAIFMQALGNYEGDGATYYDDRLAVYKTRSTELWAYTDSTKTDIRNTNPSNVGIGTNNPAVRLHVTDGGGAAIKAPARLRTDRICDGLGSSCFDTSAITGTPDAVTDVPDPTKKGIRCPNGYVMVGISQGNEECSKITFTPPPGNRECSGATPWLGGIRSNGEVICVP